MKRNPDTFTVVFASLMAALANLLGFFAIPGPWNIKFGLTGVPILFAGFVLGPYWGMLAGLFGGFAQAVNYGSIWYVLYTAIQGGAVGIFARQIKLTKLASPLMGLFGGFFLLWWIDLLWAGQHTFAQLTAENSAKLFGTRSFGGLPYAGCTGGIVLALFFLVLAARAKPASIRHLTLAGCFAAVAYVPYDALILYKVQDYPWIPTWFVLGKDLIQDFFAAYLCAWLYTRPRIAEFFSARRNTTTAT